MKSKSVPEGFNVTTINERLKTLAEVWPELSYPCHYGDYQGNHIRYRKDGKLGYRCPKCAGTGRVMKEDADLLVAIEHCLGQHGGWIVTYTSITENSGQSPSCNNYYQVYDVTTHSLVYVGANADRLVAAIEALEYLTEKHK